MTLTEIAEIVMRSRAAGLMAVDYQLGKSLLRVRWAGGDQARPPPKQASTVVKAPCAGLFRLARLASPSSALQGEVIAYLQIGPCRRALEAPCPGKLLIKAEENRLVGYGDVLFEVAPGM